MKYMSEKTGRLYSTEEDLRKAEDEYDKQQSVIEAKKKERSSRAKEVEDAYKEAAEAQKKANGLYAKADKLLEDFAKDYNGYHLTIRENSPILVRQPESVLDFMLKDFFNF